MNKLLGKKFQEHGVKKVIPDLLANSSPDDLELAYAFLECAQIKEMYAGKLQVQFDVADRDLVRESPCRVYADELTNLDELIQRPLADLVSILIVENDGFVVPMQYGFSRAYGLGNLRDDSFRPPCRSVENECLPIFPTTVSQCV